MEFDFRPIADKCPKAFEKLKGWMLECYGEGYNFNVTALGELCFVGKLKEGKMLNPLELDFFFDRYGIGGCAILQRDLKTWHARIMCENDYGKASREPIPRYSRPETLTALWNKEFEILEEQLNPANSST